MAVVWFAPERLAGFKQQLLAVFAALLAGLMAFFLTGDLGIERSWLKASGGLGAFALLLFLWPKLVPSAAPEPLPVARDGARSPGRAAGRGRRGALVGGRREEEGRWGVGETRRPGRRSPGGSEGHGLRGQGLLARQPGGDPRPGFPAGGHGEAQGGPLGSGLGRVEDAAGHSVAGARVWVEGHDAEAVTTGAGGDSSLPPTRLRARWSASTSRRVIWSLPRRMRRRVGR